MPATPESQARTHAFARIIGPWLAIVPSIVVARAPQMGTFLSGFFENGVLVWFAGGLLLFSGLLIIAFHQYWSSLPAILISLLGWFLALRGFVLMAAPELIERGASASIPAMPLVRIGFGVFALMGLYLTFVGWIAQPAKGNKAAR
jgi:hypothetical protein